MTGILIAAVIVLFVGMVVIFIMGVRYESEWTKGFELDVSFSEEYAGEGESLYLYETVTNHKARILPAVCVKFKTSRYLAFEDLKSGSVSDYFYRNDVISVRGYERVIRKLKFCCRRRGEYTIREAELVGNDYFMRQKFVEKREVFARLIVYPSFVGVEKLLPVFEKNYGEMASRMPVFEDPFEYVGVREYVTGDPMNRINWKASAKTGRWQVRTSAYKAGEPALILLNLESPGNFTNYGAMEENIRIAYSLAFYLDTCGIETTILSNGSPGVRASGIGRGHMADVRRQLAVVSYDRLSGSGAELLQGAYQKAVPGWHVFFVSSAGKREIQEELLRFRRSGFPVTWIAAVIGGEDDTRGLGPGLEECVFRWK